MSYLMKTFPNESLDEGRLANFAVTSHDNSDLSLASQLHVCHCLWISNNSITKVCLAMATLFLLSLYK
jgi:hypothetical protein